jgi:MYXO-CTERM domain-containing protein
VRYPARVRFLVASAVGLGLLVGASGRADAFCRTTTSKAPAGYNPAVSGCWTDGVPLAWSVSRVPYAVSSTASTQVSVADATRVADLAFSAWNATSCATKSPAIDAFDDGPIAVPTGLEGDALVAWASCSDSASCDPAAHDVIVFDDEAWPYSDPVNTLALTTVTYGVDDGRIFEAYTEVNSAEHQLTTSEPPPAGGSTYDLQAILTHEAGHFLGLAHATESTSIMYAYYQPGAIDLTPDDSDALCAVYPPSTPKSGCACSTAGAGSDAAAGASVALAALIVLRVRRRRRHAGAR